jgi:outer membrane receptor for ferrienterochelin and colicin
MRGDPLQIYQRKAFLRNVPYSQEEWSVRQEANQRLAVNYNISESFITEEASGNRIIGMSADQMMSYSFWKIVTEIERNKASVTEYLKSVNKDFVDCFKQ